VLRDTGDSLQQRLRAGDLEGAKACFKRNDFLRPHDRLAELVLLDQLYLQHPGKLLDRAGVERTLMSAKDGSAYPEHRRIAGNMLWDLTTMRQGTALPALRVVDERDRPLDLDSLFNGPVCLAVTASWCTYCAVEMVGLEQLHQEYKGVIRIIGISLDSSAAELRSYRKAHTGQDFTWVRAMADQELRDQLRLRSLPAFFLLNDGILARSPAPLPSNGLGGLFHQAKVATEQDQRIKVWEEPEGIRDERATPPTPR
jgi:thiol-disulfide isomerase/thioredoxin